MSKPKPNGKLKIEYWPIDRLKPYERNPRKNDKVVPQMIASIKEYGFAVPVLARSSGEVVDGHLRLKAALKLRLRELPVVLCDGWSEAQVKAFRLLANRSVAWADWDMEALAGEFADLKAASFDLSLTGFSVDQCESMLFGIQSPSYSGLPAFTSKDQSGVRHVVVHFKTMEDRRLFFDKLGQPASDQTNSIWFPPVEAEYVKGVIEYASVAEIAQRYPIYIISKGRWESRYTSKALEVIGTPYRIVVEPQEYEHYAAVIAPEKILQLPFSNLGQGSIPARNWVWEHAVSEGHQRHWILDDNIKGFWRLHENKKVPLNSAVGFRVIEDFADRYTNVGMAGMQYYMFAPRKKQHPPMIQNTRIYSCILIDNSLPFRWRGRYNEDTDLSLRVLKSGRCTALFNSFLCWKETTMKMKGGNTDQLYQGDGRLKMAQSLQEQHPDCVTITRKWNRYQHHVDYSKFRENRFIPKPGVTVSSEVDEYGLILKRLAQQPDGGI